MPRLALRSSPPLDQAFALNRDSMQARGLEFWLPAVATGSAREVIRGYAPTLSASGISTEGDSLYGRGLRSDGGGTTKVTYGNPTFTDGLGAATFAGWFTILSATMFGALWGKYSGATGLGFLVAQSSAANGILLSPADYVNGRGEVASVTTPGVPFHLVALFDGSQTGNANRLQLWIDGQPKTLSFTGTIPATLPTNTLNITLFNDVPNTIPSNTRAGDVRFYNRVLSPQEIFQLWAAQTRWELYRPAKWRTIVSAPSGGTLFTINLAGTVTSAGALAKQDGKALAGSIASGGALAKKPQKSLAGTVASSGTMIRQTGKSLGGTMSSAGALAKKASKALAGSLASSGALSNIKVALLNVAGTIASSGALTRQAGKGLGGTVATGGTLTRQAGKGLAGVMASSGALAKQAQKKLAGTLGSSGALSRVKVALLTVAGTIASSGALTRTVGKGLGGTLGWAGSLVTSGGTVTAGVRLLARARSFILKARPRT